MTPAFKKNLAIALIVLWLFLPRLALLGNGLDAQRIWDTTTPDAFHFLEAARAGDLIEFWAKDHKYPLLGPYLLAPVAAGYYGAQTALGRFASAEDFINQYALGETNVFFWLRLEMLFLNLGAIWLLYRLTVRFAGGRLGRAGGAKTGLYILALAAADLYLALFAVTPRIHNFAFLGTVLTLYGSFLLLEKKSWRNYLLAFGAAGVAVSFSQSGITTMVLPLLAHFYDSGWRRPYVSKKFFSGLAVLAAIVLLVGYPQWPLSWLEAAESAPSLLSQEHALPSFSSAHLWRFLKDFFGRAETAITFLLAIGIYQVWRRKLKPEPFAVLALAQIIAFLLIFGASSVITGRFALVILPSLFFLAARVWLQIDKRSRLMYPVIFLIALQAWGIISLARIGLGGDTRAKAAAGLLARTAADVAVITTVDHHLLGIAPAPAAVNSGWTRPQGATDKLIAERNLAGPKSRAVVSWPDASAVVNERRERPIGAAVIEAGVQFAERRTYLEAEGFRLQAAYRSEPLSDTNQTAYLNWDMPVTDSWLPLAFILQRYQALGPNLYVYQRNEEIKK